MKKSLEEKFQTYSLGCDAKKWRQNDCDALLFECLRGSIKGHSPDIDAAFDGERWYRRPHGWKHCCYDPSALINQEGVLSKICRIIALKVAFHSVPLEEIVKENWFKGSTISRDMLVGLAWYAYHNKRLDISEHIISYALCHFGKMGDGDPTRTNIMPSLLSLFAWVSYRLGGPSRPWLRAFNPSTGKCGGFEAHLQVLQILLISKLRGKMKPKESEILAWHYGRQRLNPLFAIACGDTKMAEMILNTKTFWPQDRLPKASDRKESYLPQRDVGSDWEPTDSDETHPGTDFLFCYALLTGKMKNG